MRIAVIGAGSLGSLVAGLLGLAQESSGPDEEGDDIWLVGSEGSTHHLQAIKTDGLRFEIAPKVRERLPASSHDLDSRAIRNLHVTTDPAEAYPCDLAIVLVKSYRNREAGRQLQTLLGPTGLALSLQNGLGNLETLAEFVPPSRLLQGISWLGAGLAGPGRVFFASLGATTLAADPRLSPAHRLILDHLKIALERTGAALNFSQDVTGTIWGKLVVNCAVNPVAALLDLSNGALLEHEASRRLLDATAREVAAIARVAGISLPFPDEEAPAQAVQAATINSANYCSMVQDLRRGRPTEIESLNGAVVRQAQALGLDAPVNRTLADLIRVQEKLRLCSFL